MIFKNIKIPIYDAVITLIVDDSIIKCIDQSVKLSSDIKYKTEYADMDGCYIYFEAPRSHHILLRNDISIGTLSHEVFHATMGILRSLGVEFSDESEEAFAYLNGWLFEKIHNKIKNNLR